MESTQLIEISLSSNQSQTSQEQILLTNDITTNSNPNCKLRPAISRRFPSDTYVMGYSPHWNKHLKKTCDCKEIFGSECDVDRLTVLWDFTIANQQIIVDKPFERFKMSILFILNAGMCCFECEDDGTCPYWIFPKNSLV